MMKNHSNPKGISNPVGTACHVSSSLQLLFHCFPPVTDQLLKLASMVSDNDNDNDEELVYRLAGFFQRLSGTSQREPWPGSKLRKQQRRRERRLLTAFINAASKGDGNDDWKALVHEIKQANRADFDNTLGRIMIKDESESSATIDPTIFYSHLSAYVALHGKGSLRSDVPADAATSFRALIQALNCSVERELERIGTVMSIHEVDKRNRQINRSRTGQLERLKKALERIREEFRREWGGRLHSRIVGRIEDDETHSSSIERQNVIRTKKNGGMERPIPIPFPVPVLRPPGQLYFDSLESSIRSVTIEPSPIRGYDWRGLINRGEVTEEAFVWGNEDKPEEDKLTSDKDDVSVSSRSIGIQTGHVNRREGKILLPRNVKDENHVMVNIDDGVDSNPDRNVANNDNREGDLSPPEPKVDDPSKRKSKVYALEGNACYAAAVEAITSHPSTQRRSSRGKGTANTPWGMEVGGQNLNAAVVSPIENMPDQNFGTFEFSYMPSSSGSIVSNIDSSDSASVEESSGDFRVFPTQTDLDDKLKTGLCLKSVHDINHGGDTSTHSSDINTPSDLDEWSLGSFTESSEGNNSRNITEVLKIPMLDYQPTDLSGNDPVELNAKEYADLKPSAYTSDRLSRLDNSRSANPKLVETVNPDHSSSTTSSDYSSSCESSSVESTDSSDDDSESSLTDENISNQVSESVIQQVDKSRSDKNACNPEWVTRKETRFCHPLPRSLVFHLKRFEYSTSLGRVENLGGFLNIPLELDLKPCSMESASHVPPGPKTCCYNYTLIGAIVHVDPTDGREGTVYGEAPEGHYVTFVNTSIALKDGSPNEACCGHKQWIEFDDDLVRPIDRQTFNLVDVSEDELLSKDHLTAKVLSGCYVTTNNARGMHKDSNNSDCAERERRYATVVVYSRKCGCEST